MKSRKLTTLALAAVAVAAGAFASQAQAAAVISIVPSALTINIGDPLSVDIFVSGLTQSLGGYSFDVNWDGGRLGFLSGVVNPDNRMGAVPFDLSLGLSGASYGFDVLADGLITDGALFAAQGSGASFRLGTLSLSGIGNGFASIALSGFSLSNYDGSAAIPSSAEGARVCVGGNCTNVIPEPTTPLLVMAALGALALIRKQQSV